VNQQTKNEDAEEILSSEPHLPKMNYHNVKNKNNRVIISPYKKKHQLSIKKNNRK